ncbi:MAG: DNA-processing protein DprA, partial [Sulfuricaulis sp.]|nr:DNA-processing protein DprA [Sulfuricaulis sp.]
MKPIDDLAPWINLSLVRELGSKTQRALLSLFGLPSNVLGATRARLAQVVGEPLATAILSSERREPVELTLRWLEQPGNGAITLADDDYPKQLLQISDPPILIYIRGDRRLLAAPSLAVVGSRNATPQGLANAETFARALSDAGLVIASGLALGIDAAAHRGVDHRLTRTGIGKRHRQGLQHVQGGRAGQVVAKQQH